MKKVLVITYYWPPAGGGGVQRITKFCKYLIRNGWEPHVITIAKGNYQAFDHSLIDDINEIKVYYTDSNKIKNYKGPASEENSNSKIKQKSYSYLKNFIRINFFLPDSKVLWYWSALRKAKGVIAKENIDLIFSTSPPYTVQLVAKKMKKLTGLPWIVDFRDPWVENIYYNNVYRTGVSKYVNAKMEQSVLNNADKVITVGNNLKLMLEKKTKKDVTVIHNGYDNLDFPQIKTKSSKFIIGYYGSLNSKQISSGFFKLISSFRTNSSELYNDLEIHLAGNHTSDSMRLIRKFIPNNKLVYFGYMSHEDLMKEICKEQLLLQFIHEQKDNEVIIGSKIYEYFHTGNPILCLGSKQCEAAELIKETNSGVTLNYTELEKISEYIHKVYLIWKEGRLESGKKFIPAYERKNQTKQLAILFDNIISAEKK